MNNLYNPIKLKFTNIAGVNFATAGGGAGFVDTDISAAIPVGTVAVFLTAQGTAGDSAGAGAPGSGVDSAQVSLNGSHSMPIISGVSDTRHILLYNPLNVMTYRIQGYFL